MEVARVGERGTAARRRRRRAVADRKSTRLNSSHANIYTLSLHDALPISEPAPPRTTRVILPIKHFGNNRAVVECVVTQGEKDYHNLRLFVRRDGQWKLLAWANEEQPRVDGGGGQ